MIFAGHLPTKHFLQAEWLAMPVWEKRDGTWPGAGFKRARDSRGKPVVFYVPELDEERPYFICRPIVRVPMGRA